MINTVIFDLDGLLADTEATWYQVCRDMLASYGHEFALETYVQNHSGKTIVDNCTLYVNNYQLPLTVEECIKLVVTEEGRHVDMGVDLKPGAKELLEYLKENGYKAVLGTSSKKERALKILKGNQVDHLFDDFVVGYDVERSKPFPDIFLLAAERVGAKPEECLVLEDSESGIRAGYAAGIPVICVPDLKQPGEECAAMTTKIADSLFDVIDYLKEDRK